MDGPPHWSGARLAQESDGVFGGGFEEDCDRTYIAFGIYAPPPDIPPGPPLMSQPLVRYFETPQHGPPILSIDTTFTQNIVPQWPDAGPSAPGMPAGETESHWFGNGIGPLPPGPTFLSVPSPPVGPGADFDDAFNGPNSASDSVSAAPSPAVSTGAESSSSAASAEVRCEWDGCGRTISGTSRKAIERHLQKWHLDVGQRAWKDVKHNKAQCRWGGRCDAAKRPMYLQSLATHIASIHVQSTRVYCEHCGRSQSRKSELPRHHKTCQVLVPHA